MSNERLKGWKKQETAFNYAEEREFGPGLRAGGLYADLGVAKATGGQFHAHVIKVNPEKHDHDGTTGMHRHDYDFQFNYVLKPEFDSCAYISGLGERRGVDKSRLCGAGHGICTRFT